MRIILTFIIVSLTVLGGQAQSNLMKTEDILALKNVLVTQNRFGTYERNGLKVALVTTTCSAMSIESHAIQFSCYGVLSESVASGSYDPGNDANEKEFSFTVKQGSKRYEYYIEKKDVKNVIDIFREILSKSYSEEEITYSYNIDDQLSIIADNDDSGGFFSSSTRQIELRISKGRRYSRYFFYRKDFNKIIQKLEEFESYL
ncbi:hypothetical protein OAT16_08365 [Prolixibacteraceae bacterium]|nr:hypothetical protein [Prolixibacteraceae bacterium]